MGIAKEKQGNEWIQILKAEIQEELTSSEFNKEELLYKIDLLKKIKPQ
jgi:hypothetical protein